MQALVRVILMLALLPTVAHAETSPDSASPFESSLGFTVTLPATWVVLQPTARDLRELETDPRFAGLDQKVFSSSLEKVRSGQFEFFFRKPFDGFAQNIAIRRRQLTLPANAEALSKECAAIPASLRQNFGRDVSPPVCEIRSVGGLHATYIQVEGPIADTATLQYQIQRSPGEVLAITATVLTGNISSIRDEFDSIVKSLRLKPTPR